MKKKLMLITTIVMVVALAAAGTAFAANGNETAEPLRAEDGNGNGYGRSEEKGTSQRFASQAEMYETEEEFHAAVLAEKLAIIEAKVADGSLSEEDAATIRDHLTSCDGTCEIEGENPNKPEDGWGIFGQSGQGVKGGNRGSGNGESLRSQDCDEEGTPVQDGSGSENGQGYRGGKNN